MDDYRRVADTVASEIAGGRLRPGDQLPPQRTFARRHGIANSTANRVYQELTRRGLVTGEVGRGTFVRLSSPVEPALAEPSGTPVDLTLTFPTVAGQAALQSAALAPLLRPDVLELSLRPVGATGTAAARAATAALLTGTDWAPEAARVLFAGSGRQALAAAIAALVPAGGRLGVEVVTYPVVRAVASRLGVTLVPLACDGSGLRADAVAAAHRRDPLRAVYLQPTLHNPLTTTMPPARRAELAGTLQRLDLCAIEDGIWRFLGGDLPPLAALAPGHVVYVDSLSKRLAPGLTVGFLVSPPAHSDAIATALRSGCWLAGRFALEAATRWSTDGTVQRISLAKHADAAARQAVLVRQFADFPVRTDPYSYFCWWELPARWRAEAFVAAAARRGIAVSPGSGFCVERGSAPHAVRLGLATPPMETLSGALGVLATLARGDPAEHLDD